jgi:lipoate-protein ligase A
MRLLDFSFRDPAENLAFDEVLLNGAEEGDTLRQGVPLPCGKVSPETLRFWESPVPFVVLGVSQTLRQEVWEKNCADDGVRILRRASAGGCVLQGPGCLNFSLILSHGLHPEIKTIRGSYCFILGRICDALQRRGVRAHHKGISDIAVSGRKVSGSSQKRRRLFMLHHGTLLHGDTFRKVSPFIDRMERCLREPVNRPQYRGTRTHRGFIQTLPLDPQELRRAVCEAFGVDRPPARPSRWEIDAAKRLASDKYRLLEWIRQR